MNGLDGLRNKLNYWWETLWWTDKLVVICTVINVVCTIINGIKLICR